MSRIDKPRRQERILVVEDDPTLRLGLTKALRSEGYAVETAKTGREGLERASNERFDAVLLDVMLPERNGYEVCEALRALDDDLPVLMLTAKTEEADRVRGLRLGADDYITKPFGVAELLARIDAALRRRRKQEIATQALTIGAASVDFTAHRVVRGDQEIEVTAQELKLLRFFLDREGQLLSRQQILDGVWGTDYFGTDRTVDNFVNRLRTKFEHERALRFLLTGHEKEQDVRLPSTVATTPIANALQRYFEEDEAGRVLIDVYAFGMGPRTGQGVYDIAEAKRSVLEQDLTAKVNIGRSISAGDWIALPRALGEKRADMPHPDRSLLVFYFDLGDKRVPSRYDAYLPLPSEEIVARLERGEAFVAARERQNARPTIVLAAPRAAQLELVEAAFNKMTELPLEPVAVPISAGLLPSEIQGHVRRARGTFAACYEDALKRVPTLSGALTLNYEIDGRGRVNKLTLEPSGLDEQGLLSCVREAAEKIEFPATGGPSIMVRYPLQMTP
jgi:DNA-binding response OmpR family regulator